MTVAFSSLAASLMGLAERWGDVYNGHVALQTTVGFAHVGGLLVAGGLAIASDRMTLRALRADRRTRRRALEELHAVHRPVLAGLMVVVLSGVLLFAADLKTFIASPVYWIKLGLVGLLLANGALLTVVERRLLARESDAAAPDGLTRNWRRLRIIAVTSIALWLATAFFGTLLLNAGS